MALRSQLLRDDPKLEAAAVSDQAHITGGAKGDHVRKIQRALNQLDGARLSVDGNYGFATAAAVLAYKRKRNIVNRSYQNTADEIVGKMTIAALDTELLALENVPGALVSLNPAPIFGPITARGPILAFRFTDSEAVGARSVGTPTVGAPSLALIDLVPAPVSQQTVIAPIRIGIVKAINFAGGVVVLSEPPNDNITVPRIAKLISGTSLRTSGKLDNADVVSNPEEFRFQTFTDCGIVKMQAIGPGAKKSAITDFFVLTDKSSYVDEPVHPVDSAYSSGLVSERGTPLNPLPGRRINIFGRGESNGFENYSSSIPFCNDTGGPKPWTDDPRKPSVGIANNSVMNICIRSSPIKQITVDEIKRIAAPGCRVTFAGPAGFANFINKLRTDFLASGLARTPPREDGPGKFGQALVFELK